MYTLIDKNYGVLFSSSDLRETLEKRKALLNSEIEQIDPNRLLNTAPADLKEYLVEKYSIEAPKLKQDEMTADQRETKIDISQDLHRWVNNRDEPLLIPGQHIEIQIPFDGDSELFFARASTFSFAPPSAKIHGQSLLLIFDIAYNDSSDIRSKIDRAIEDIEQYLEWTRSDVNSFNQNIEGIINAAIENRRQRILTNMGRLASLGIPLKTRVDDNKTYSVPLTRKKIVPILPPATSVPYEPEPVLDAENYEHILNIIQNMALVMERSPSAFRVMGEEDLRQHFLVQLNGQFEGAATGETFNFNGKTDILLRVNNRNVFIAECKFWNGPKRYQETINQLLSYTAWRDTKTAILVFNRTNTMTTVLSGIQEQSVNHPNYKRTLDWKHESGFRYVFHQNGDVNREMTLTVLVFDIPSEEQPHARKYN